MAKQIYHPAFGLLPEPLLLTSAVREAALDFLDGCPGRLVDERNMSFLRAVLEITEDRETRLAILGQLQKEQRLREIRITRRDLSDEKKGLIQ